MALEKYIDATVNVKDIAEQFAVDAESLQKDFGEQFPVKVKISAIQDEETKEITHLGYEYE